jgi:hypothetical protein
MARLNEDAWENVRSDWCTGHYTYRQLAEKHGVSDAAIIKKSKAEEWQKLEKDIVDAYVDARVASRQAIAEVSKVSKVSTEKLARSLDSVSDEKSDIHGDLTEVRGILMDSIRGRQAAGEIVPMDCKIAMDAIAKEHEVKFGKAPDSQTNIQVNNQLPAVSVTFGD